MDLETAREWTANYQGSETERTGQESPIKAHAFGKSRIAGLMSQEGAVALRIYPAHDGEGNVHMVLVAVDPNGDNIVGEALSGTSSPSDNLLQYGGQCPPDCGSTQSGL